MTIEENGTQQCNAIAMASGNTYNENCHQQTLIMEGSLPLFDDIKLESNLTIADYGCSQGGNSIPVVNRILSRVPSGATVSLVFEDLPSNEYTSLIKLLPRLFGSYSSLKLYPSLVPKSFYESVVPSGSVDLGYTLSTIHWLKKMPLPKPPTETVAEYYDKRDSRNSAAAKEDLRDFLTLRGQEIKSGGHLVIACFGSFTKEEIAHYKDALILRHRVLFQGMETLANEGKLPLKVMERINVPIYDRSEKELFSGIDELKDTWVVDKYYRKMVHHPAYYKFLKACEDAGQNESEKIKAAKEYAGTLIDWLIAVFGDMILGWWRESGVEEAAIDGLHQEFLIRAKDLLWKEGPGGAEIPIMYTRLKRV
ncbi:Methyltransferase FUS9 [Drechslerella dactyloides]|uniref:Methyltransferase FUS9 n=1 Tax=Drechslerella dactyloides TaxID=74499 RepID=A0AAD6IV27_DREDA|nr:Methyltransferase FUS9 [Drechslerella dactyloides]